MAGPTWPSFSPQSTHGLSPAALGSVWLSGCTWLPCRCSLTTLKPFVPIPDRGTSLCTNPVPRLASPPLTSLRSLGQWSQRHRLPALFLLFPCLPKTEKTNKTMLLDRGCLLWAWDYLDALPLCSCQGWSSSLQGPASGDGWGLWALLLSSAVPFYPS